MTRDNNDSVGVHKLLDEFREAAHEMIDPCTIGTPEERLDALKELADTVDYLQSLVALEVANKG